jgi:WD40 repeat protein
MATSSADKTAIIWSEKGDLPQVLRGHEAPVKAVAFRPDGKHLTSVSEDKTARVWDVKTGETVMKLTFADVAYGVTYSRDGKWLAVSTIGETSQISIRSADSGEELLLIPNVGGARSMAFNLDGTLLACAGVGLTVRIFEITKKEN